MASVVELLYAAFIFTARRNARNRIASAVLAIAIPSVRPYVRPSVCPPVRHTPVLCRNDGTFALLDSASTVRDRKRSSITLNKNSARAFQRAIHQGSYAAPNFLKMGIKMPRFVVFWTISTIKDEKSAAKFHYIKTFSGKVVAQSIAFRVVSI